MPQVSISLPRQAIVTLEAHAARTGQSFSSVACNMVIDGINQLSAPDKFEAIALAMVADGVAEDMEQAKGALAVMQEHFGEDFQALTDAVPA